MKESNRPARVDATRSRLKKWVADPEATYFYPRVTYSEKIVSEDLNAGFTEYEQSNHAFFAYLVNPSEWATPIKNWQPGMPLYFVVTYGDDGCTFSHTHNVAEVYSIHSDRKEAQASLDALEPREMHFYTFHRKEIVEVTGVLRDEYYGR